MAIFDTLDTRKLAVTTGGTEPNYTVTVSPAPTAYVNGMTITFYAHQTLTSIGATINVNGLGNQSLAIANNSTNRLRNPYPGEIRADVIYTASYTGFEFIVHNPTYGGTIIPYTPTLATSAGTVTVNSNDSHYRFINGNSVHVSIRCLAELSGSISGWISATLPVSMNVQMNNATSSAWSNGASGVPEFLCLGIFDNGSIKFYRNDFAAWQIDTNFFLAAQAIYSVA